MRTRDQREVGRQCCGCIDVSVAVHAAETNEIGVLQPWNPPETAGLRGVGELGLASYQVEHGAVAVFRAELEDGPGPFPGPGIDEAHGLERAEYQSPLAARGQRLHGHAALEMGFLLKIPAGYLFVFHQSLIEIEIFLFSHGAVQIIAFARLGIA